MLTISKALNAQQAHTYHAKEFTAKEQSYWQKAAPVGEWQGRLAEEFGSTGPVDSEQFRLLSEGKHPLTEAILVKQRASHAYATEGGRTVQSVEHRAGWDATFSAPKSVPLTALVGGDERVRHAHAEAVTAALTELERYTHARLGGNTPAERTGSFAVAKFEQDTARPVDGYAAPQLHTHAVIFNVTKTDDGRARALQEKALFETQGFATAVYQTELAVRLRRLGYELETGRSGAPEIRGFTREYLDASSPRSQQIQTYLEKHGVEGPEAAQIAAHSTRDSKQQLGPEASLSAHREIAALYGNQAERVVREAHSREIMAHHKPDLQELVREAVTYAKQKGFEREAVIDERILIRDALRRGVGELTYRDIRPAFDQRVASGEFVEAGSHRHASARAMTTPETIAIEREAVSRVISFQGTQEPILKPEVAANYAASREILNSGQRDAVISVLTSEDKVHGLQGLAGTGKTTTLATIREAAEHQGYAVQGFAPTSKAAGQLREAGIEAGTLQGFLARGGQDQDAGDPQRRHLYMLDESSLASTRQMQAFLEKVSAYDRVLLIGDIRQHQGVDAGKPFEQIQAAGMQTARLDIIVRQKDPELLAAVEHLSRNETTIGIAMLAQQGRITEIADKVSRTEAIAKTYADQPQGTIVVSADNASRRDINQAVREELQSRGALSKESSSFQTLIPRSDMTGADRQWASQYRLGDVLHYARGSEAFGIEPQSYGIVRGIDPAANTLTVQMKDGPLATYDPKRLHGISAYQEIARELATGDRIQFTAPSKALQVANRDLATIIRIDGNQITARLDGADKRSVTFDVRDTRHFDHGYAMTSHSSQGVTVDRVLINADTRAHPALVSSRFAYVAASRASHDVQIFTNDAGNLGQRLRRDVSKASAVDLGQKIPAHSGVTSHQTKSLEFNW